MLLSTFCSVSVCQQDHAEAQLEGADKVIIEGFQDLTSQVEQLDQTSRAAIMVCGLPERHGPDSSSLADAVG